ncbi:general transcription factor IIIA, b [Cynoglossus semilaevis]|uniref:Transcription factor IIIA n=1 Tax=Cynoglossus semilaevis TaxID=244447 RepID=A0A3P8WEE1_CYNSE|nr:transcription factor IIIA [Cynoglossus semilaevis]
MGERLQSQKSYICSFFDCKAKFTKSWKLEAHLCKHTGLKPFSCESCDKSFCTRYQLTRHELTHSGEKPHKCSADGCSEAFITNASMKNHMARVHQHWEKPYKCNYQGCGKDFNKRNQLRSHQAGHGQPGAFKCNVQGCAKEFPSQGKLKNHEKVHKGYPCETESCPFLGQTWTEYLKHRKGHKVKVPCAECKKQFNNSWFLHLHRLQVHCGQRKTWSCTKDGCEKEFTRSFHLESHVLSEHDGKKTFSCAHPGCEKSFAMKESLWRHGVVHDPEKKKLKKIKAKKNRPQHKAPVVRPAATANVTKLAAKLRKTTLVDKKS